MIVDNKEAYRFVNIVRPPSPYGVGLDDGEDEYWIEFYNHHENKTCRCCGGIMRNKIKIFSRSHLPVDSERGPLSPWVEEEIEELKSIGELLSTVRINSCGEIRADNLD